MNDFAHAERPRDAPLPTLQASESQPTGVIMDTQTDAAQGGGAPSDIVQIPAPGNEPLSPREAARTLAGFRNKQRAGGERDTDAPQASEAPPEIVAAQDELPAPAEE